MKDCLSLIRVYLSSLLLCLVRIPDWRHPIQDITIRELAEQIRLTNQKIQNILLPFLRSV